MMNPMFPAYLKPASQKHHPTIRLTVICLTVRQQQVKQDLEGSSCRNGYSSVDCLLWIVVGLQQEVIEEGGRR